MGKKVENDEFLLCVSMVRKRFLFVSKYRVCVGDDFPVQLMRVKKQHPIRQNAEHQGQAKMTEEWDYVAEFFHLFQ